MADWHMDDKTPGSIAERVMSNTVRRVAHAYPMSELGFYSEDAPSMWVCNVYTFEGESVVERHGARFLIDNDDDWAAESAAYEYGERWVDA